MKQRLLNTKIWSDSWFRQKLNPLDRYLFIYFLTNEHTSICGIYELPLETIAFETGLDTHDLNKSLLPRLQPKIWYKNNYVIIPNFVRHQNWNSPKVKTGIMAEISYIPQEIIDLAIGYGYPIDTISHSNSNSNSNSNTNTNFNDFYSVYPKKVQKSVALKSWNKLNPDDKLLKAILKDIAVRKITEEWLKGSGRFIPYPATYLNQRRWEDEDKGTAPQLKPFFRGDPMVKVHGKWKVIDGGEFKEFVGDEKNIEYK